MCVRVVVIWSYQEIYKRYKFIYMVKTKLPTHIEILSGEYQIEKDSVILLEQLRTIDKKRLKDKVCHLDGPVMNRVDHALKVSLQLDT